MRICNEQEFMKFLTELKDTYFEGGTLLNDEHNLDLLDYHWFLMSILESIDKDYILEILDDIDGLTRNYKIHSAEVDDLCKNRVIIHLFCLDELHWNNEQQHQYLIKKVSDARDRGIYKYFITTDTAKYRFRMIVH